jgi:hypothetical protein
MVSDVMKYSENRLRRLWGIKSRLSIYALPTEIKGYVDEYFDRILLNAKSVGAISRTSKKRAEELEYEKLYAAPAEPFSLARASQIEEGSWDTTKLLVDTFEDESNFEIIEEAVSNNTENKAENKNTLEEALGEKYEFLIAVLTENVKEQRNIIQRLGVLSEALVDEINEIAYDLLGDILIEDDGEKLTIIEEYREEIGGQING